MSDLFMRFAVSLLLGAFIGLEREQDAKRMLGIRTFSLVSLMGSVSALVGASTSNPWFVPLAFFGLALLLVGGRIVREQIKTLPGMTTEIAAMVTFGLGVIIYYEQMELAVALGVATAALLHFKPQLHRLADLIGARDLYAILQFAIVTFIILPVLPNRTFGPFNVLNPYNIWLMVVLVSGLSLLAYLALRLVGARYGSLASGVLGGLVSSTAVTVSFSQQAREAPVFAQSALLAVLAATSVTVLRIGVIMAIVNQQFAREGSMALGALFLGCALPAIACWLSCRGTTIEDAPRVKNPTKLGFAVTFALIYSIVTLATAFAHQYAGGAGLYAVSAVSGVTDVDAITLSTARLAGQGTLPVPVGVDMVIIAFLVNQGFKTLLTVLIGPPAMWRRMVAASVLIVVAGLIGIFAF